MRRVPENRNVAGLAFFVTFRLISSEPLFAKGQAAQIAIEALQFYRQRGDIDLYGFAVMPDHVHMIVKMNGDVTLMWWMNRFKSYVGRQLGKGPIWQRGYWSEVVPDIPFLEQKLRYVHENPVRAGLVVSPEDYAWSSARDYLCQATSDRVDRYR
ncbi:transposase [bacterium]|nr:transposase [bacterium]MBU1985014.1 transposase [bacterium]